MIRRPGFSHRLRDRMKISVVTVCRNAADTIRDALKSVAVQTHPDVEHLIVDGGSTDGTTEVIRANAGRVARWESEPDGGIYEAMNKGLEWATGEFICYLNADDAYCRPDALAHLVEALRREGADAAHADLAYVHRSVPSRRLRVWTGRPFQSGLFRRGWAPAHTTFLARTRLLRELGGFDVQYRLAADFDLMYRLLEGRGAISTYVPCEIVHMRVGGATGASGRNLVRQNLEILRALRAGGDLPNPLLFAARKVIVRAAQHLRVHASATVRHGAC